MRLSLLPSFPATLASVFLLLRSSSTSCANGLTLNLQSGKSALGVVQNLKRKASDNAITAMLPGNTTILFPVTTSVNVREGGAMYIAGSSENGATVNLLVNGELETCTGSISDTINGKVYQFSTNTDGSITTTVTLWDAFPGEEEPEVVDELQKELDITTNVASSKQVSIDVMVPWTYRAECAHSNLDANCATTEQTAQKMMDLAELAVQETNTAYTSSGINAQLLLVHAYREDKSYVETSNSNTLNHLRTNNDGYMDGVHAKRIKYGADIVAMIGSICCGIGYLGPSSNIMFSVSAYSTATGYYTFGHEIGHNFGCNHDRGAKNACDSTDYRFGYKNPNSEFRSILAYPCSYPFCDGTVGSASCPRVQMFSNNKFKYQNKIIGDDENNNARRIIEKITTVAAYYPHVVQTKSPTTSPTTTSPTLSPVDSPNPSSLNTSPPTISPTPMIVNLLTNPGFEDGIGAWSAHGPCSISIQSSEVRSGSNAAAISGRTKKFSGITQFLVENALESGMSYVLSAWIKLQNASNDNVSAHLKIIDDNGTSYRRIGLVTEAYNDTWTEIGGKFILSFKEPVTEISIYWAGPEIDVEFYLDDAYLAPILSVVPTSSNPTESPTKTPIVKPSTTSSSLPSVSPSKPNEPSPPTTPVSGFLKWRIWASREMLERPDVYWYLREIKLYSSSDCTGTYNNHGIAIDSRNLGAGYLPKFAFNNDNSNFWAGYPDVDGLYWIGMDFDPERLQIGCVSFKDNKNYGVTEMRVDGWDEKLNSWKTIAEGKGHVSGTTQYVPIPLIQTIAPTSEPSEAPSSIPSDISSKPSTVPSSFPSNSSSEPSTIPSSMPSNSSLGPSTAPSSMPSNSSSGPSEAPSSMPSNSSSEPSKVPSSALPSVSSSPSSVPTDSQPLEQYTPERTDWSTFNNKAVLEHSKKHGPLT